MLRIAKEEHLRIIDSMIVNVIGIIAIVLSLQLPLNAQAPSAQKSSAELSTLEENVAKQFNVLRQRAGLKPLVFRRDIRLRMESCSIAFDKPALGYVEIPSTHFKWWYSTEHPGGENAELSRIASAKLTESNFGVGVWFTAKDDQHQGTYWILVYPEHSAAGEWFWRHLYLTDDFEYVTPFDKSWRRELPKQCQQIR